MRQTFYIETMGCQMNKLDSELIVNQLIRCGYRRTDDPDQAGVIIFNTCSVRHHAEDKVISKIGQFQRPRRQEDDFVLAVVGCMAERLGQKLLDDYRQVDIVCGPGQLHRLSAMIQHVRENHRVNRVISLNDPDQTDELEQLDVHHQRIDIGVPFQAYLRVMRGCNNYCSYCIVPYVRGPERSRPLENIVAEARRLIAGGVKEITLLGQAVNYYRYHKDTREIGLADVLEAIHEIEGLVRLRFVTSYPRNFDERILQAMSQLPKVCPYLHIPAQSGSDRILKAMNRHYTAAQYMEIIDRARAMVPGFTVAGDFIVGFPGETDQDHTGTIDLIRKARYKNCFIFKYSPRPGTLADHKMPDDVPAQVKQHRLRQLLDLQNEISYADNQEFIDQTVEVLVEGPSKKPHLNITGGPQPGSTDSKNSPNLQLVGRTPGDHIVVFSGHENLIGKLVSLKVTKVSALTLFAELLYVS